MEAKPERLQKILAAAGLASRRKAEELIAAGLVSVNGHTVTELGTKADPRLDEIRVEGKLLRGPERHVYLAMYKPKGHMTTVSDPEGRPTVMDLLKGVEERVFPVGRLDYMSEGLLLLTNDGDLMAQLTRAGAHVAKTYMVKVSGKPTEESLEKLRNGIMLPPEPGLAGARGKKQPGVERRSFAVLTQPAVIQLAVDQENPWYEVTLTEGRNRQLRRMFEQVGHHIEKIKRVRYGSLTLDLEPGEFRHLTPKEVNQLRKSLDTPFKPRPVKVKRRDERPERKPRLDTARFVKGRRGKPSADAPAEATPTVVRRAPAGISRSATAPAYGSAAPRRAFTAREDRGPARGGFVRPRGPEFAAGGEERPKRTYTRKPEGVERTSDDRRPSDRRPSDRKAGDRGTSGGFERKPRSFDRKPSGDRLPRREGAPAKRGAAGLEGGARGAAPAGGFGFDKFAKPKFVKPSKHRDLGSDTSSGSDERKTFSVRPYSKERGAASDRDFSGKPGGFEKRPGGFGKTGSFGKAGGFAKPGGFTGSRKFSKGPGKPTSGEGRTGSDSKRSGEFKRAGEARTGSRGGDFGKGFGARPGSAPPRGGSSARPGGSGFKRAGGSGFAKPDFKGAGGGGARRPSSPARGSGPARRPSSGPSRPRRDE